jgi:predicted ATPase
MQKIIIKNFAAIEYAEIEIRKVLVLIGEQASGKSTIAKLIYFFKTLKEDIFSQIYRDKRKYLDIDSDILFPIRSKFYKFFGSTNNLHDFEIFFYYDFEKNKYIKFSSERNQEMKIIYTNLINEQFKNSASGLKLRLSQEYLNSNYNIESLINEEDKIRYAQQLYTLLSKLFESKETDSLFIISGRSATVSYSDFFEKYLFASVQSSLKENISNSNYEHNGQKIDEILMLKFMKKIIKTRDIFNKFGNIEELTYGRNITLETRRKLSVIINKVNKILKGKYYIDPYGTEKIRLNDKENNYVYLSHASSGQQEVIRILQDIFLNILDDVKVLRIIEEPEAHLFPVAQKQLIELLSLMVNHDEDNQLIITTHSPYILTVFNNLLFANRVVEKNSSVESEVAEIIPQDAWLKAEDFSAYSLGNQSSEQTNYCESIFNTEKGTIQQNYLDTVSEILGSDFQDLYSIHARTFARR